MRLCFCRRVTDGVHSRSSEETPPRRDDFSLWLNVFDDAIRCMQQQSELKTSTKKSKKALEAEAKAEEEASTKSGGCSNKTVKFDNLINPKTLKAFDKKNVSPLSSLRMNSGKGIV